MFYMYLCIEKIRLVYKSKYNKERENQVILLIITGGKKWHYLAVTKLALHSTTLRNNIKS